MSQGGWNPPPGGYAPSPNGGYGAPPPPPYQQAAPQAPPLAAPAWAPAAQQAKGFFSGLFDFSFENFVALKVIKVLYGFFLLALVFGILGGVGTAVMSVLNEQVLAGFGMLVVTPILAFVYLVVGRVYFELIIVAFKIAEDADEIARNTRK
jgi:Domain of unknown function (DUF4282)